MMDGGTLRVLLPKREVRLGDLTPAGLACGLDGVAWLVDPGQDVVACIDLSTGAEIRRFGARHVQGGIALDGENLYLVAGPEPRLRRLSARTGDRLDERLFEFPVPVDAGLAFDAGTLWVALRAGGEWVGVDVASGAIVERLSQPGVRGGVEVAEGCLWGTDAARGALVRLGWPAPWERRRRRWLEHPVMGAPHDLGFDGWLFWYIEKLGRTLYAVRP